MKKSAQSGFNIIAVGGAVCAMLCLIFAPAEAIESARYGLSLCAELIVPSLLPFFAASSLLIRLRVPVSLGHLLAPAARRLWGVSGAGASAFLSGICGGYPLGAQTVAEMYGEGLLSKDESERLLGFCNNSGPSFLIGVIGSGVFSSRRAGLLLYIAHVLAAALVGILFRKPGAPLSPLPHVEAPPFSSALVDSVRQAVSAVLSVCGFVICFCVFSGLLDTLGVFQAAASPDCGDQQLGGGGSPRLSGWYAGAGQRDRTNARALPFSSAFCACSLSRRMGRTVRSVSNSRCSRRNRAFSSPPSDRPAAQRHSLCTAGASAGQAVSLVLNCRERLLNFCAGCAILIPSCRCDGMVDVTDSKSVGGDTVWVRVPPPAPREAAPALLAPFAHPPPAFLSPVGLGYLGW